MVQFVKGQQVVHCRDGLAVIVDETIISEKEYFVVKTIRILPSIVPNVKVKSTQSALKTLKHYFQNSIRTFCRMLRFLMSNTIKFYPLSLLGRIILTFGEIP